MTSAGEPRLSMDRKAIEELLRRRGMRNGIRGGLFSRQLGVLDDRARFRAGHPGRRGGKSVTMGAGASLDVLSAGPGESVIVAAETQKKSKALHWQSVMSLAVQYGLPLTPRSQEGCFVTPWDSRLVFWGLSSTADVELLRGFKMKSFWGDETATWAHRIPHLVSSILEPALGDLDGTCTLLGTPTVTAVGPWAEICMGVTPGWSVHHWDVRDNEKFPRDARSMLKQVLLRNKWTEDNATYQREWLGNFVNDTDMLVYQYDPKRNQAACLPVAEGAGTTTLGIDYGTSTDPTAWVILWSQRGSRDVYVVEARKATGLLPDEAAAVTKELVERWKPVRIVGDGGGLGAPYVRAYNRRYAGAGATWVQPASKLGVLGQIAIASGELASGRIILLPAAGELAAELAVLPWKDTKKVEQDAAYPNHCADAMRYAYMDHWAASALPDATLTDEERAVMERVKRAQQKSRPVY